MSYNQYSGYGGNPYGHDDNQAAAGGGGYGASNPYGSTEQNPYGNTQNYNDTVSYKSMMFERMRSSNGPTRHPSRLPRSANNTPTTPKRLKNQTTAMPPHQAPATLTVTLLHHSAPATRTAMLLLRLNPRAFLHKRARRMAQ